MGLISHQNDECPLREMDERLHSRDKCPVGPHR